MARRVFFSFHYKHDVWRANIVRMSNVVAGPDTAGFFDHSEYEEAKFYGDDGIRRMIARHLHNTTVTVVLIGTFTSERPWVKYEVEQSILRKNGLLGIYINHLVVPSQPTSPMGLKPLVPARLDFPAYSWDGNLNRFRTEIEAAGQRADALRR